MHAAACGPSTYIAIGTHDRLVKLVDYDDGSFVDLGGASTVQGTVNFSPASNELVTGGDGEILLFQLGDEEDGEEQEV